MTNSLQWHPWNSKHCTTAFLPPCSVSTELPHGSWNRLIGITTFQHYHARRCKSTFPFGYLAFLWSQNEYKMHWLILICLIEAFHLVISTAPSPRPTKAPVAKVNLCPFHPNIDATVARGASPYKIPSSHPPVQPLLQGFMPSGNYSLLLATIWPMSSFLLPHQIIQMSTPC